MADVTIGKEELSELVTNIKTCIEPYQKAESFSEISSTTALQDSDPQTELEKLSKLIKAHSTKIGIICQPDKFYQNFNAVYTELQSFNDKIFLLLSLLPLFHKDKKDLWANFFIKGLDSSISNLLNGVSTLCQELDRLIIEENNQKDERLLAVGLIWNACDILTELAQKGNFPVLAESIRSNCSLIDDVLQDITSWVEDPQLGNGLVLDDENSFSGLEDDDVTDSKKEVKNDENEEKILKEMEKFIKEWETNLKMIKLLLSSFSKSLTSNIYNSKESKGSTLEKLYILQHEVIEEIDELISDFLVSDSSFKTTDFDPSINLLNERLKKIVLIIKKLNKSDTKKSKWIQVWEAKYFQDGKVIN